MKKLLIDLLSAQPIGGSKFHGGGEYIKRVFKFFVENYSQEVLISTFYNFDVFLDDYLKDLIVQCGIVVYDIKSIDELPIHFTKFQYDIYYTGYPYSYDKIEFANWIKCVGTFHGFRPIEKYTDIIEEMYYPGLKVLKPILKQIFYKIRIKSIKTRYWKSLQKFERIICVSNHTKYALLNYFPQFHMDCVKVFYTPAKYSEQKNSEYIRKEIACYGKYILLIGLNRWEKNGYRALKALEGLFDYGYLADYKVVTVGKIPVKIRHKLHHPEKYICNDYVEPEFLEELYQECEMFFFPSLNEGFGLPPFEAMKYGKTCIISSVCSLPELCGNAVYYANPYDIDEMRNRLLNAAFEKIDIDIVLNQYNKVYLRQESDLRKLCEYIIGK